jgi:peptidoglycan/xylan/chitin deacetylase (PgdA/CDA1 family)
MRYLRDNHYKALDLEEAGAVLEAGESSQHLVVLTFDDGYRDFYTEAYPILEECGLRATVFVVSGFTGDDRLERGGNEYLTWAEVRELSARGIRIGSHTMTHPRLYNLTPAELDAEVGVSKAMLEQKAGERVSTFSYPFAFPEADGGFVRRLKNTLEAHGYRAGVSTVIGTARKSSDRMILPRLPVNSWDDPALFQAKLEGGYDWLHSIQYFHKVLKGEPHDHGGV